MNPTIHELKQLERYLESCLREGEFVHGHLKTIKKCIEYFEQKGD